MDPPIIPRPDDIKPTEACQRSWPLRLFGREAKNLTQQHTLGTERRARGVRQNVGEGEREGDKKMKRRKEMKRVMVSINLSLFLLRVASDFFFFSFFLTVGVIFLYLLCVMK